MGTAARAQRADSGATLYIDKVQLQAWFAKARAGQSVAYAFGANVDRRNEIAALVWDWAQTGEVDLFKQRDLRTGRLAHMVRRKAKVAIEAQGERGESGRRARVQVDEEFRETPEGKVFLALVRAANFGAPCPGNAELARVAGLRDADAASYRIKQLIAAGRITVRVAGEARNSERVVTIVETGRRTAERGA